MKSHPRDTDIFSTILFSINRSLSLPFSLSHSNNNTCAHAQFLLGLFLFKRFHPFRFRGRQLRSHPWLFPLFCSREHPLTKPTGLTMKKNLCPFLSMHPATPWFQHHLSLAWLPRSPQLVSTPTLSLLQSASYTAYDLIFLSHISFHNHFMTMLSWLLSVLITLQSCPLLQGAILCKPYILSTLRN